MYETAYPTFFNFLFGVPGHVAVSQTALGLYQTQCFNPRPKTPRRYPPNRGTGF